MKRKSAKNKITSAKPLPAQSSTFAFSSEAQLETANPSNSKSRVLAIAGFLLTAAISVATAVGTYKANRILMRQAKISREQIISQERCQIQNNQLAQAKADYEAIRDILLNPLSPVPTQTYALRNVPLAMRACEDQWNAGKHTRYYPNAKRLRMVLLEYFKANRPPQASATIGFEIIKLLHSLGPVDKNRPDCCLWTIPDMLSKEDWQRYTRIKSRATGIMRVFDLAHVEPRAFVGFSAPNLFQYIPSAKILFPSEVNFGGGNLSGANLARCSLRNANFRLCNLTNADLRGADLQGADFSRATMDGAKWESILPP